MYRTNAAMRSYRLPYEQVQRRGVHTRTVYEDEFVQNGLCQFGSRRWFYGPPVVVLSLSIAELVLFYASPALVYEWAIRVPRRPGEAWQLLSCIFVHFDEIHLYSNLFVQIIVGITLEVLHGPVRTLIIYLGAGVIGGAFEALLTTRSPVYIAGASGAIYGLIGAFGANLFFNWNEALYPYTWLLLFVAYFTFDIAYSLSVQSTVALWAHYTGALAGLLFALAVARNIRVQWYEPLVRAAALAVDITLLVAVVALFAHV